LIAKTRAKGPEGERLTWGEGRKGEKKSEAELTSEASYDLNATEKRQKSETQAHTLVERALRGKIKMKKWEKKLTKGKKKWKASKGN